MRAAKARKREQAIADGWTPEPAFRRHSTPMHPDRTVQDLAVLFAGCACNPQSAIRNPQ